MIEKVTNECIISGKLYGFGRFGLNKDQEGTIKGSVIVATDVDCLNTVEVSFLPQKEKYKNGKDNNNYKVLDKIIKEQKTVENVGENSAFKVRVTGSLTTNTYYTKVEDDFILVEDFQVKGNFIHIDDKAKFDCGFNIDCLIQSIETELNTEGIETERRTINVKVFDDYRKFFFPLTFKIDMPEGIAYMETEYLPGESYATLSGEIVNKSIEAPQQSTGMGFGESAQVNKPRTVREIMITGAKSPMEFILTEDEIAEVQKNRENFLAENKNRAIEKSKKTNTTTNTGFQTTSNVVKTTDKKYEF